MNAHCARPISSLLLPRRERRDVRYLQKHVLDRVCRAVCGSLCGATCAFRRPHRRTERAAEKARFRLRRTGASTNGSRIAMHATRIDGRSCGATVRWLQRRCSSLRIPSAFAIARHRRRQGEQIVHAGRGIGRGLVRPPMSTLHAGRGCQSRWPGGWCN